MRASSVQCYACAPPIGPRLRLPSFRGPRAQGDGVDASAKSVSAQVALELAESALRVAVRDGWDKAQTPAWVEAVVRGAIAGVRLAGRHPSAHGG